ncbi:MAG TPA: FtsX-like permease family protein [Gemmataceae bacterium]|nr:FtsX-like permease family protein [Gemmataceae bacterium]
MYMVLLCWRYLKTRYLAFACIISVMLGVATLIVVNSVMNGFSAKLRNLLHGVVSDVVIEGHGMDGFTDPYGKIARIRKDPYLNEQIEAMAVTLEAFAMVQFQNQATGEMVTRPVRVMGIDVDSRSKVGGFWQNLHSYKVQKEKNEKNHTDTALPPASFTIPKHVEDAYLRIEEGVEQDRFIDSVFPKKDDPKLDGFGIPEGLKDLFKEDAKEKKDKLPPPMPVPHNPRVPKGAIVGHLIAHFKFRDPNTGEVKEAEAIGPGDTIVITTVSGQRLTPVYDSFVVTDYFRSEMSEYDANSIFVPLDHLQHLRNMENRGSNILIRLKNYDEAAKVTDKLREMFGRTLLVHTWEEKQGPLLKAIEIEKRILNVLLFMIIAVAGFGILAIFSMIVSEKTRDIGILKALGASSGGILRIFLGYGLLLGVVGAGMGTILGLSITWNINEVEHVLAAATGGDVFDKTIYYFNEIPTQVSPYAVTVVNIGAMAIAIVFSILPALRAAMLHPVQALRYE